MRCRGLIGATAAFAALAGCAREEAPPPNLQVDTSTYAFSIPGEPGHTRESSGIIFGNRIMFRNPGSAGWYQATITERQESGTTRRLLVGRMTVTIEKGKCVGDAARPDRVTIEYPPNVYQGCGGSRVVPGAIGGTTWTLRELDGQRVPDGPSPAATLTFGPDNRVGGTNACNDVSAGIKWREGRFETPPAPYNETMTTLMGCSKTPNSAFGDRFWIRLGDARTWTRDGATLWITFADGSRAGLSLIL